MPDAGPADGASAAADAGDSGSSVDGANAEHPYVAAVRADAPVSWYRFEEDSGANVARDEIGGHDATLVAGAMGFGAEGIAGRGLASDGTGAGLQIGDVYDFDGTVPFTLELWVDPTPTTIDQRIVNKRAEGSGPLLGYILYVAGKDHAVNFEGWGVSLAAWSDTPLPARFTHVVVTVAYENGKGNATLWLDAQPQPHSGFDNVDKMPNTKRPLRLLEDFKGRADEVAIYDKALSAARILEHYRAGTR